MATTTNLSEAVDNPRSRRALLAGVVGGLGAWLVSAAQRAMPAAAGVGDPIRQGQLNNAGGSNTTLQTSSLGPAYKVRQNGGGTAIRGESPTGHAAILETGSPSKHGLIVRNASGDGGSFDGAALSAEGKRNYGILAKSDTNYAIVAATQAPSQFYVPAITGEGPRVGVHGNGHIGFGVHGESGTGIGVYGFSNDGYGVFGLSNYGDGVVGRTEGPGKYAGRFEGSVFATSFYQFAEITDPSAPSANRARLFVRDSGGKGQLCVRFATGAVQVIATEP